MGMRLQAIGWLLGLASTALAQDGLTGTWEYVATDATSSTETRLVLDRDGTATLRSRARLQGNLLQVAELEWQDESPGADAGLDTTRIEIDGSGTWQALDSRLMLDLTQRQVRIDGGSFRAAVDALAEMLAQSLAILLEVPDSDYPALLGNIRSTLQASLTEDEVLRDMVRLLQDGIAYELDGDNLRLDDGEGGAETWVRQHPTAVRQTSWAQFKITRTEMTWIR